MTQTYNKEIVDKMDAEIMDLFYEWVKISFGVDMVQDSTELREILEENLASFTPTKFDKEIREEFMKLRDEAFYSLEAFGLDKKAIADWWLERTIPRSELKKVLEEVMEDWASKEHDRWAKWQKYMHSKILPTEHESLMQIGTEWIERWEKQINTPYSELSEKEKESDREQVRPYLSNLTDRFNLK